MHERVLGGVVGAVLAVLAVAACGGGPTSQQPVAPGATIVGSEVPRSNPSDGPLLTDEFGGAVYGFVAASSTNGRYVFLYRFPDGEKPTFHQHGETDKPIELIAYDRFTGSHTKVDELISLSSRRWFLVLAGGHVSLLDADAGSWEELDDIDMGADDNACLAPRHASFSANGKRVAWINASANGVHVRDLVGGDEWDVASSSPVWRAWPDDVGDAVVVLEVPKGSSGWPAQRTSCACRWCLQFAASYGVYGWDGPDFTVMRVSPDGTREDAEPPEGEVEYEGGTDGGCTLEVAETDELGLSLGPWKWVCPATDV